MPDFTFTRGLSGSPPFIKEEQEEFGYPTAKFMSNQQFSTQFNAGMDGSGIDPSNLMMNGNMMNNNYNQLNHSFGMGNSIQDEDLEYLVGEENNFDVGNNQPNFFQNNQPGTSISHQPGMNVYSNTPDAAPISSPFTRPFNYNQYNIPMGTSLAQRVKMERHPSDSRSPMTPKTPALSGLHIGTPESLSHNQQLHQQARMQANQWDGTPGSNQSWLDSPLPSPHGHHMQQPSIHEVMRNQGSVPGRMEGAHSASLPLQPSLVSQEAKKKRRRESHNLVERRRRDNINERIQDLSRVVPTHRLEDEKVRKHITANGPLSPHGVSPPSAGMASSSLAPANGRRAAAGTITTGLPPEEKEKGPNKGDILNGAVAWTRDLMWQSYLLIKQQEQAKEYVESIGGTWPIQHSENEQRMLSELAQVIERNGFNTFHYSRADGSQLRVPGFTNYAGEPVMNDGTYLKSEDDEANFWLNNGGESGRTSLGIKEEDEDLGMDMG